MITPAFALTATERVLPKLALDFTTAVLDSRVTFTRSGNTATVVNSAGLIASVNADIPRFDYDPVTLACKGLLIEESRTNMLRYSEQFDQSAVWATGPASASTFQGTGSQAIVTANYSVSPDGTQNADRVQLNLNGGTTSADRSGVSQGINYAATSYVLSCYIKSLNAVPEATLVTALITAFTITSTSVIPAGDGWYRAFWFGTSSGGAGSLRLQLLGGRGVDVADFAIYGAQLEAGAFATSYIPTTTTALTRNADVATMTGTNFSDWFNASEGTFSVQANVTSLATQQYVFSAIQGASFNNAIGVNTQLAGSYLYVGDAGVTQAAILSAVTANTNAKFVGAYKANSFAYTTNAANTSTDSSGTVPTVDNLIIGSRNGGAAHFNGTMQAIYYYPQRLTNAEVQAFSK